jgi:hypothetical protein
VELWFAIARGDACMEHRYSTKLRVHIAVEAVGYALRNETTIRTSLILIANRFCLRRRSHQKESPSPMFRMRYSAILRTRSSGTGSL